MLKLWRTGPLIQELRLSKLRLLNVPRSQLAAESGSAEAGAARTLAGKENHE